MGELAKAHLIELRAQGETWVPSEEHTVRVQFNPSTLKVSYSNQLSGGEQPGGSPKQFIGQSTTKMSVELWFDTTADGSDVRARTRHVAYFIQPQAGPTPGREIPPRIRFSWGSFLFDGVVDSLEEALEFFSEEGVPLRASTTISISEQAFQFSPPGAGNGARLPGMDPLHSAQSGDSVQSLAQRAGRGADWQTIAAANGIDDPRRLAPGQTLRLS